MANKLNALEGCWIEVDNRGKAAVKYGASDRVVLSGGMAAVIRENAATPDHLDIVIGPTGSELLLPVYQVTVPACVAVSMSQVLRFIASRVNERADVDAYRRKQAAAANGHNYGHGLLRELRRA